MSITVYILHKPLELDKDFWQYALPLLSLERRQKVLRVRSVREKIYSAAVFLLLRMGLYEQYGIEDMPQFIYGDYGKPALCNSHVHFSFSACQHAVVCALATVNVGFDVESWDSFSTALYPCELLQRVFTVKEVAMIHEASIREGEEGRKKMICGLWTMKESQVKYTGEGLRCAVPVLCSDVRTEQYTFTGYSAALCYRAQTEKKIVWRYINAVDMLAVC